MISKSMVSRITLICTAFFVAGPQQSLYAQKTTLQMLISQVAAKEEVPKSSLKFARLESEWVGDVTSKDGQVSKLRLEYGVIRNGKVQLARMFNNRYVGSDAPFYIESMPKGKDLESLKTAKELEAHFGKSQGFTSGWGGNDRLHWSMGWTYISAVPEKENRLRYLTVFARVSRAGGPKSGAPVEIDEISYSEGTLRPADPESKTEKTEFPTGEALFVAEQKKKGDKRLKYPMPLRKLIEADEHPDDSDLVHYKKHLNLIRENPDPELFRQLLSVIDEGTLARRGNLEAILVDSWLNLEPWKPVNRKLAIRTCIEGIPLVKESARSGLMVILLKANGGGVIEFGDSRIEVIVEEGSESQRHGQALATVSIQETQRRLTKMLIDE